MCGLSRRDLAAALVISLTGLKNFLLFAKRGEGALVGMIGGGIWDDATTAHITAMYVTESARGQGVSTRLMATLLDEFRADNELVRATLTVNKNQLAAVALYEKFGFRTISETSELMGDGNLYDGLVMEKILDR